MKKGNFILDKTDRDCFYKIEKVGKKTILLKVYQVIDRQEGGFTGKWQGYYKKELRSEIENNLGRRYSIIW